MHVFYVFGLATYTDYSFGVCDVVYVIRASLAGAVYYRLWLQYRRKVLRCTALLSKKGCESLVRGCTVY